MSLQSDFPLPITPTEEASLSDEGPEGEADFWGFDGGNPSLLSMALWDSSRIAKMSETEEKINGDKASCSLPVSVTKPTRILSLQRGLVDDKFGYETEIFDRRCREANIHRSSNLDSRPEMNNCPGGPPQRFPKSRFSLYHKAHHKRSNSTATQKRSFAYDIANIREYGTSK
ncbi:hypothetical protein N7471_013551 [Penicillium samsonianum]|uniref:uncharacterized protein n=1 Tax=Penicillium samsonianum TaxID=1882272 RepID=UPI002549BB86|nr:uncharacterized protein N7471_013551 [Penicillium samsonianum]KAJ6118931.1 hypothetical protein N7471_013551 [Penicillium samsonianum]